MNRIRCICCSLAGLPRRAGALAASAAAVPAAAATVPPLPPGWNHRPPMPLEYISGPVVKVPGRTVVIGGMPGWQIALIAAGAALLAAVLAVIADRARAARRRAGPIGSAFSPGAQTQWEFIQPSKPWRR
jgi:hypothetical protein